jgi:hypothetical protein
VRCCVHSNIQTGLEKMMSSVSYIGMNLRTQKDVGLVIPVAVITPHKNLNM